MKGQVSTELLVIVALVLLVFIPLLVMVYLKAGEANQEIGSYQGELAVSRVASLANSVGSLGTNTSVTTDVFLPPNTVSFMAANAGIGAELTLKLNTGQGTNEISLPVKYPISAGSGNIAGAMSAGGWVKVRITSQYSANGATLKMEKV